MHVLVPNPSSESGLKMETYLKRSLGFAVLAVPLLFAAAEASAATVTAANCSQSAVQSALNSAANGDTVVIPNGTCTWSGLLNVDARNRNIHLRGQSVTGTIINAAAAPMVSIQGVAGYTWRFSDMTISAAASGQEIVSVNGTAKNWRINNINFTNTGSSLFLFTIRGDTFGVIDHLNVSGGNSGIISLIGGGFSSWTNPEYAAWGTDKAVFLEDSVININDHNEGRLTIDCTNGGRYVLRNNVITNQRTGNHGLDTGGYASCLSSEIYRNKFVYTSTWDTISGVVYWRGGSTLVHSNTIQYSSSTWGSNHFKLLNFRAGDGSVGWPACNGTRYSLSSTVTAAWGGTVAFSTGGTQRMCSGNRMRICSSDSTCAAAGEGSCTEYIDGQAGSGSYPCFMQVGRGLNNMSNPSYAWGNTFSGGQGAGGFSCPGGGCAANTFTPGTNIAAGRDYFDNTAKPGYAPYQYPHPLQSSATVDPGSGPTPLPAPLQLRVQ